MSEAFKWSKNQNNIKKFTLGSLTPTLTCTHSIPFLFTAVCNFYCLSFSFVCLCKYKKYKYICIYNYFSFSYIKSNFVYPLFCSLLFPFINIFWDLIFNYTVFFLWTSLTGKQPSCLHTLTITDNVARNNFACMLFHICTNIWIG